MKKTGPDQATRDAVHQRDGYACVLCSRSDCGARRIPHHRLPRSRGGDNRLSNLVLLGDFGGCHDLQVEMARTQSYGSGWLIRTGQDPAKTPIVYFGSWVLLGDDGSVTPVAAPEEASAPEEVSASAARRRAAKELWGRVATDEALEDGPCWAWPASLNDRGYGMTTRCGERLAHRAAWVVAFGPIPPGLSVCHRCDNPPCIRPSHLFLGTHAENMADMSRKGRATTAREFQNGKTKVSDATVLAIVEAVRGGRTRKEVAREYGLHPTYVGRIAAGKRRSVTNIKESA